MKKLEKSLNFLTKIMLVVGLLISNLSSLSVVFASEVKLDVRVVDDKLYIEYLDEIADDVESVKVNVYENYTYLDDTYYVDEVTSLKGKVSSYDLSLKNEEENINVVTEEENTEDDELEESNKEISLVVDTILSSVVFDGIYEVTVEIVDTTDENNKNVIETQDYSMALFHDAGLELTVVDATTGLEVELLEDGRYAVDYDNPQVKVVAKVLAGGLSPMDMFLYKDQEYMASELLGLEFTSEIDFNGRLYGDYIVPVAVDLSKYNYDTNEYVFVEFIEEELKVDLLYGEYELNTLAMNNTALELELNNSYVFNGDTKDGIVYVLLNENKINTMYDLYLIANFMFADNEYVSYKLSNDSYEDILSNYDETVETLSFEEYLNEIKLDDGALISFINDGLTVTYKVVIAGDINDDNKLTEEDLLELINQTVVDGEVNLEKSDLYELDGEVNTLDVMYLDQVIKNSDWNVNLVEQLENSIAAELQVVETDIVSGQEFTVNYVVKLSDCTINGVTGLFTYDENVLELKKIETFNQWFGNNKDGKFLYIGEESLELPVIEDTEDNTLESEIPNIDEVMSDDMDVENETSDDIEANEDTDDSLNDEIAEEIITEDYVVVSATFVAKKSGIHTINVENREYFNQDTYYGVEEESVSVEVLVNASDNNNLSSLVVGGQEIILQEGKLDYEITVSNDVTTADVVAMVQNVAANITSIVGPEELVEGENIITVTVTAESGDVKVYTIKVIREKSLEEEKNSQVYYDNYYEDYDNDEGVSIDKTVVTEPEEDDVLDDGTTDKESNLSRIVIIILILLVIAGLIYLIFKDEDAEELNKDINKLRKEEKQDVKNKQNNNISRNNKSNNTKNKKKER